MPHPLNRPHRTPEGGALAPEEAARVVREQAHRLGRLATVFNIEIPVSVLRAMNTAAEDVISMQLSNGFTSDELVRLTDEELLRLLERNGKL